MALTALKNIDHKFRKQWLLSLCMGLIPTYSVYSLWIDQTPLTSFWKVVVFLGLTFVFAAVVKALVQLIFQPKLANLSRSTRFMVWAVSIVLAVWLMANLPMLHLPTPLHIEITALGTKDDAALGSEVWLQNLYPSVGQPIRQDEWMIQGEWVRREGMWGSYQNQPAEITWSGKEKTPLTLVFLAHEWSGEVAVAVNGQSQIVDLYSNKTTTKSVNIPLSNDSSFTMRQAVLFLSNVALLTFLFVMLSFGLAKDQANDRRTAASRRWGWVPYALPMVLVWSLYLLVYWPGILTNDSSDQWGQLLNGVFVDSHPAFHTMLVWLLTRVWLSPAWVVIAQILSFSALAGYILTKFEQWGVPKVLLWMACLLIALHPANGMMVITLWKDFPYMLLLILLSFLMIEIYRSEGQWFNQRLNVVFVASLAAALALMRHNGLAAGFGSLLLLIPLYRKQWKALSLALVLGLGLWLLVRYPVYSLLQVQRVESTESLAVPFVHHIAAHLEADTELEPAERYELMKLRPIFDDWSYTCYNVTPTFFSEKFHRVRLMNGRAYRVVKISMDLFLRDPLVDVNHMMCAASEIWRFDPPPNVYVAVFGLYRDSINQVRTIAPYGEQLGLKFESVLPGWVEPLTQWLESGLRSPVLRMVFYSPAMYLFIAVIGTLLKIIKEKNAKIAVILLPILLHSAFLFLLIVSQSFRYQYPIVVFLLVFWPFLFSPGRMVSQHSI